ncbi:hypothetical protein NDU88_004541 [Pleurodeles waltl]|uniref:Uncharacterized protein n=1 Tax=Pleurodeles waltl TaxID=8319 RepID=A0AAV7VGL3_PLEWA|nr:hypothetical protein NDU88_004541 [Pleurodeles waltl]
MGWHKRTNTLQGNTMEHYTTPVPRSQRPARSDENGDTIGAPVNPEEPSRAELLATIQGSRVALEGKIETVAVEMNLLRADLRKVSDKVRVAEGSIVELQTEVGALRKQMAQANSTVGRLEARLEDAEGRSWRNKRAGTGLRSQSGDTTGRNNGGSVYRFGWGRDVELG